MVMAGSTYHDLYVSWDSYPNATSFLLCINDTNPGYCGIIDGTKTGYRITRLNPFTTYTISLIAIVERESSGRASVIATTNEHSKINSIACQRYF